MGHPPGLVFLFIVEMWERFSFYGMRAMLILYLVCMTVSQQQKAESDIKTRIAAAQAAATAPATASAPAAASESIAAATAGAATTAPSMMPTPEEIKASQKDPRGPGRGLSEPDAGVIYGWYAGLGYLLAMLGGIIADKLLGQHRSMIVGGILIALGHISLGISGLGDLNQNHAGLSVFIFGLGLVVLGTGHFKPNVSVMVDRLYSPGDSRRDGAFTVFYMGVNTGAFFGPLACGSLALAFGWHFGFAAAAFGMIAGLIIYLIGRKKYLGEIGAAPVPANYSPLFVIAGIVIAGALALLFHQGTLGAIGAAFDSFIALSPWLILSAVILIILGASAWFVSIQERADRGPVSVILIFVIFNAIFWLAFEQAGSSLNLFAEKYTRRDFLGIKIPAEFFQSVGALMVVVLAPIFAGLWNFLSRRNMNPGQPMKLALGLMLAGFGYVFMIFGSMGTTTVLQASAIWLIMTYLIHTIGELCISPTGLSFVTRHAPVRFVSFLMGVFFLSNFVANKVGGQLGGQVGRVTRGEVKLPWNIGGQADFYMLFVVTSVGAGVFVLIFVPVLNKLLRRPAKEAQLKSLPV
jgi:POT family proton-dependent oligopeptide transporter